MIQNRQLLQELEFCIGTSTDTAYELKMGIDLQLLYVSSLHDPLQKEVGKIIHETRRSCKRCRAILRLMRDAMGYASYFRENRSVRDLQRELSRIRDADVQYQLFVRLSEGLPENARNTWYAGLIKRARTNLDQELDHFLKGDKAVQIAGLARSIAARIRTYELTGQGFGIIEGGLTRTYRQGREMGAVAFSENAEDHLVHELRKKAKYLQNQLFYLRGVHEPLFTAMSLTLEQLTEKLGQYNDLRLGCKSIEEYAEHHNLKQKDYGLILERVRNEMLMLKSDSRIIFVNVYSEPPAAFIRRIGRYWELYRNYH